MAFRVHTVLFGRNLPKALGHRTPEPSTINEKTVADFTRVLVQQGLPYRKPAGQEPEA